MAGSRPRGPIQHEISVGIVPARTRNPLGRGDAGDPDAHAQAGDTGGPVGVHDHAAQLASCHTLPTLHGRVAFGRLPLAKHESKKIPPRKKPHPTPIAAVELNVVGVFENSCWKGQSDAAILAAAKAGDWYPSEENVAFARKGSKGEILREHDVYSLLYTLGNRGRNHPQSIQTLNIFTHGAEGWVGLSGKVIYEQGKPEGGRGNVEWAKGKFVEFRPFLIDEILSNEAMTVFGTEKMTRNQRFNEDVTILDVRKAFAADAQIVIYACHAGLDAPYLTKIATLFQRKVSGFKKMIRYTPTAHNGRIVDMTYGIEGSARQVSDFHQLNGIAGGTNDLVTVVPEKLKPKSDD